MNLLRNLNAASRVLATFGAGVAIVLSLSRVPTVAAQVVIVPQGLGTSTNAALLSGDLAQFLDGSMLHGALHSISVPSGVRWKHPTAKQLIQFGPANLDTIRFDQVRALASPTKATCRFRFQNGDEFSGNLLSIDEKTLSLETWFGKNLQVPRSAIDSVSFLSKTMTLLYEGPTSSQGWHFGRGNQAWQYRDGALITSGVGTVGRKFDLPGSCSMEFDISWLGASFELVVPFYTDAIDRFDYGTSSYMFHFRQNSVALQRIHSELGVMNLGRAAEIPNPRKKNNFHVEIRASKEESTLAVLIDGVIVQKWKDDAGFSAKGSGVVFFSQLEGPTIKINNIKVSEWDGRFEDERPAGLTNQSDTLRLANRDTVAGALEYLRDGKFRFAAGDTSLDIPLQRVSQILFRAGPTNQVTSEPWQIRAFLTGGEKLSFKLEQWDEKQVAGTSPSLGKLSLNPEAIRQIQFNLEKSKPGGESTVEASEWEFDAADNFVAMHDREDAVVFRNGDLLYGTLRSLQPQTNLQWQRVDVAEPIEFDPNGVSEIRFRQTTNVPAPADLRVGLSNYDLVEGRIREFDSDKLVLETWYAGDLTLPRKRVQSLIPLSPHRSTVFQGPTGIEGWTMGKVTAVENGGDWKYQNNAFYATKAASIARDMNLPDVARIEFDLAWKGTLQTAIALYTSHLQPVNLATKDAEPDFGGFYSLQINNVSAGLMMVKKDAPLRYLWQLPAPNLTQKNSAHIEIRVHKARRMIMLYIDGVLFKNAVEVEDFAGSGTCMRFVHQGNGSLKLSNLRISDWDGLSEDRYLNAKGGEDLLRLRNGDKAQGTVEKFRDGKFSVTMEGSKLDIPIDRIKQIDLAGKKLELPVQDSSEVVAYFKTGAPINFRIESWDQTGIHASSPNFGKATLNPAAFTRLQFKARDEQAPAK